MVETAVKDDPMTATLTSGEKSSEPARCIDSQPLILKKYLERQSRYIRGETDHNKKTP
tara:strand:+ start:430 stop:603 length:174 start_codon:yes stop_codon:yes gene_type:complete